MRFDSLAEVVGLDLARKAEDWGVVERRVPSVISEGTLVRVDGGVFVKVGNDPEDPRQGLYLNGGGYVRREDSIANREVIELPKMAMGEWIKCYPGALENAWMPDMKPYWGEYCDRKRANEILAKVRRKSSEQYVRVPSLGHVLGEEGYRGGEKYRFLGKSSKAGKIWIAGIDKRTNGPMRLEVDESEFRPAYLVSNADPRDHMKGNLPDERYTAKKFNLVARDFDAMQRPFYVAGCRIDGSVIQHAGKEEVVEVDFENDPVLKGFYDELTSEYERQVVAGQMKVSLPVFLTRKVAERMRYNEQLVDAMTGGGLGVLLAYQNVCDKWRQAGINVDAVKAAVARGVGRGGEKVKIGEYLSMNVGICRQQAEVLGACMERAIEQGRAIGWAGVEIRGNMSETDGHGWVVCKDNRGEESVYDPAQNPESLPSRRWWGYKNGYERHRFGVPNT